MKLYYLTESFYNSAISILVEVEKKSNRPYAMICIKIDNNLFAVPLRSNIQHPHHYPTSTTENNIKGIDYSKAIIITMDCLNTKRKVTIDKDEFCVLRGKDRIIADQFKVYIKKYKSIIQKKKGIFAHPPESVKSARKVLQNVGFNVL